MTRDLSRWPLLAVVVCLAALTVYATSRSVYMRDLRTGIVFRDQSLQEYHEALVGTRDFPYQWRLAGVYLVRAGERLTGDLEMGVVAHDLRQRPVPSAGRAGAARDAEEQRQSPAAVQRVLVSSGARDRPLVGSLLKDLGPTSVIYLLLAYPVIAIRELRHFLPLAIVVLPAGIGALEAAARRPAPVEC